MRLTLLLCILFSTTTLVQAQREGGTAVRGLLVSASATPGQTDPQLKPYEATLRRILRFESFRFLGEGRAAVAVPGNATVMLGQGHKLVVHTEESPDDRLRVQVDWQERSKSLMRTGLTLHRGVPAVIGGPARGEGEVFAVIVVAD